MMKVLKICFLLITFCLTSCGNNASKTSLKWQMSEEAKALYDHFIKNPDNVYFKPGKAFNETLVNISSRKDEPQLMPDGIDLKNKPTLSKCNNENVYTFSPLEYKNIVLYIHGGAYIFGADPMHYKYCDGLLDALNAKVVLPLYPLAPQHIFTVAYEMIDKIYDELLKENKPIYLMGDSAGGGFALGYTQYLIANKKKTPNKLILISPWIDITLSNPDIKNYEAKDTNLACFGARIFGKLWVGENDDKDYRLSPKFGSYLNLPDMMIFTSDSEIVCPDILKLYNDVNCNVKLIIGEGYFHVFPIYDILEKSKSFNLIADFIK